MTDNLPVPDRPRQKVPQWLLDPVKRDRVFEVWKRYQRHQHVSDISRDLGISVSQAYLDIQRAKQEARMRFQDDLETWTAECIDARRDTIRRAKEALTAMLDQVTPSAEHAAVVAPVGEELVPPDGPVPAPPPPRRPDVFIQAKLFTEIFKVISDQQKGIEDLYLVRERAARGGNLEAPATGPTAGGTVVVIDMKGALEAQKQAALSTPTNAAALPEPEDGLGLEGELVDEDEEAAIEGDFNPAD